MNKIEEKKGNGRGRKTTKDTHNKRKAYSRRDLAGLPPPGILTWTLTLSASLLHTLLVASRAQTPPAPSSSPRPSLHFCTYSYHISLSFYRPSSTFSYSSGDHWKDSRARARCCLWITVSRCRVCPSASSLHGFPVAFEHALTCFVLRPRFLLYRHTPKTIPALIAILLPPDTRIEPERNYYHQELQSFLPMSPLLSCSV